MIDRDKKDKEMIPIKLTGKQLTILVTGLFLVSVLSFVFGALVMRGMNSQDHEEYFASEPNIDLSSDSIVSLENEGLTDVEQKVAVTTPVSDTIQPSIVVPVSGETSAEKTPADSTQTKMDAVKTESTVPDMTENKKPMKGPIMSAAPVAEKISAGSVMESKKGLIGASKKIEDVKRHEEQQVISQDKKRSGMYTIQIIAYRDIDKANKLRDELIKKGYDSYIDGVDIPNKGRYYRVRVGDYSSKEAAYHTVDSIFSKENETMKFGKPMVVLK